MSALVLTLILFPPPQIVFVREQSTAKGWWNQEPPSRRGRKQDVNLVVPWSYSKDIRARKSDAQGPYFQLELHWSNQRTESGVFPKGF